MALAFDAFAQSNTASGNANLSFSHTCSGSDRILIVAISEEGGGAISSVTYNGVAATAIDTQGTLHLYRLVGPATGSNTVSITRAGTTGTLYGWSYSLTGAGSSQPDAFTKNSAAGATSLTGTLTTVTDNCWSVMVARADNAGMTPSTNCTERSTPESYDAWAFFDNSGVAPITPAGSYSMTFSSGNGNLSLVMAAIAPGTQTVTNTSKFFSLF